MNKFIVKAKNAIANKKAEMFVSKAVWIVGVLIVGALLVWGIYEIMANSVMNQLKTTINDMFEVAKKVNNNTVTEAKAPNAGS